MSVRLSALDDLLMPRRVVEREDSNEDVRVVLQLKILRRNDAGKDHAMVLEYDSGQADGVIICDELQKGAGKLRLTRDELKTINYAVNECERIAHMARASRDDDD